MNGTWLGGGRGHLAPHFVSGTIESSLKVMLNQSSMSKKEARRPGFHSSLCSDKSNAQSPQPDSRVNKIVSQLRDLARTRQKGGGGLAFFTFLAFHYNHIVRLLKGFTWKKMV